MKGQFYIEDLFQDRAGFERYQEMLDVFGKENILSLKCEMDGGMYNITLAAVTGYYKTLACEIGYNVLGDTYFVRIPRLGIYEVSKDLSVVAEIATTYFKKATA